MTVKIDNRLQGSEYVFYKCFVDLCVAGIIMHTGDSEGGSVIKTVHSSAAKALWWITVSR